MDRAFAIIRLSTQDQLKGYGAAVQWDDDILPNAPILGLEVSEDNRRVIQESATGWERTKFEMAVREALTLHQHGRIEALLFPRVDRETRFLFGSFPLLAEVIKAGLRVYFAREKLALDPNDPESVERYLNKAQQSQAYIETMKANTLQAKAKLVKRGCLPQGTGIGKYGYSWDKEQKRRVPLEDEVKIVGKVFAMYDEGANRYQVAKTLNAQGIPTKSGGKWHPLTVGRMLSDLAYIGLTYFGKTRGSRKTSVRQCPKEEWQLLPDATPAIISKELFDRAQENLKRDKELRRGHPKYEYLLTGHIACGYCGSPMVGSCLNRGRYRYYHCRGTYPTATREAICNAHYIKADPLEETVWGKIREVLENPQVILAELQWQAKAQRSQAAGELNTDKEISRLRRKIRNYEYQEKRLLRLFRYDEIAEDSILDELNQLKQERQLDEEQLTRLLQSKEQLTKLARAEIKLNEFCLRVRQNLIECTIREKKLALDALDIRVVATQENAEINQTIPIEVTPMQSSDGSLTIAQTWA